MEEYFCKLNEQRKKLEYKIWGLQCDLNDLTKKIVIDRIEEFRISDPLEEKPSEDELKLIRQFYYRVRDFSSDCRRLSSSQGKSIERCQISFSGFQHDNLNSIDIDTYSNICYEIPYPNGELPYIFEMYGISYAFFIDDGKRQIMYSSMDEIEQIEGCKEFYQRIVM